MYIIHKQITLPFFKKTLTIPLLTRKPIVTPHLVVVKKVRKQCDCSYEQKMLEQLQAQNLYVSTFSLPKHLEIPLALIPFRVALINRSAPMRKQLEKATARIGWRIVYYDREELQRDFYEVMRRIHAALEAKTLC